MNKFSGAESGKIMHHAEDIRLSTDNGTTWTAAVDSGLGYPSIQSLAVSGGALFAGTVHGVFLSTDNGASWTAVNSGLTDTSILSMAVGGGNVFAGTDSGGVFLTTNNGETWT